MLTILINNRQQSCLDAYGLIISMPIAAQSRINLVVA